MARELHSLNETEMGMVTEYVEAGIASSHEEALKFLLESGMIQDRVGGGGTYIPEGYAYLKFQCNFLLLMFWSSQMCAASSRPFIPGIS